MRSPSPVGEVVPLGHVTDRFWLLNLSVWAAFAATTIVASLPYPRATLAWLQTLVIAGFGSAVSAGLRPVYRRVIGGRGGPTALAAVVVGASVVAGTLWTVLHNTVPILVFGALGVAVREVGDWRMVLRGNLFDSAIMLAWSLGYLVLVQETALREERERALRAEVAQRDAKLAALRYQLNPHFLFNVLNALSTLVLQGQNDVARRMISRLGGFLRGILVGEETALVTVGDELELLAQYLEVERIRFGNRLVITTAVDSRVLTATVPGLLLQPLAENAIRHAVAVDTALAEVSIVVGQDGTDLRVTIVNTGRLAVPEEVGTGIGLSNSRERLRTLYGDRGHLSLAPNGPEQTMITLRIPLGDR